MQFSRAAIGIGAVGSDSVVNMDRMVEIFPVLARVRKEKGERVALVSETIIEEVLQDIGELDFGDGRVRRGRAGGRRLPGDVSNIYKYYVAYRLLIEERDRRDATKAELKKTAK